MGQSPDLYAGGARREPGAIHGRLARRISVTVPAASAGTACSTIALCIGSRASPQASGMPAAPIMSSVSLSKTFQLAYRQDDCAFASQSNLESFDSTEPVWHP